MSTLRIRPLSIAQALQWVPCGLRLWRRQWLTAFIPALIFMLVFLLLRYLPVLGDVLILLFLPTVFASFLIQAHLVANTSAGTARPPRAKGMRVLLLQSTRDVRQTLLGAWSQSANILPLVLVGFVFLFVGLAAHALLNAVGGQAVVSLYGFLELPAMQMFRLLLAYGTVMLLWVAIMLLVFWTLPLLVLRDMALVEALIQNLRALRHNTLALTVYLLVLVGGLVPLVAVRLWSSLAGFLVLWLGGAVLVTLLGFGAYCSYRLVFATAEHSPRPSQP